MLYSICFSATPTLLLVMVEKSLSLLFQQQIKKKTEASIHHLLESIRALQIPHENSEIAPYLTVSIGGYLHTPKTDESIDSLIDKMIAKADSALYRAKSDGRNRGYLDD